MLKTKLHALWILIGFALILPQMPVFAGEHPGDEHAGEPAKKALIKGILDMEKK